MPEALPSVPKGRHPVSIHAFPRFGRQWMLDHVSIRLRLALWYALLLSFALTLFSSVVFAVAQNQLQASVDQNLQSRASSIAATLSGELQANSDSANATASATVTPSPGAHPSPARPAGTPTHTGTPGTSSGTPGTSSGTTPTVAPTPVPTPDPKIQQETQNLLNLNVPDVLRRLDLGFEVLNARGTPTYCAPNTANCGLPINEDVIQAALTQGICGTYTQTQPGQQGTLLRIYVQPVTLPLSSSNGHTSNTASAPAGSCQVYNPSVQVVGAVVAAKPLDDVNNSLSTLSRLLIIGVIVAVLFTSAGAWLIVGNGLQPIARMTRTARAIAINAHAAGLGRRVGYRGPRDEVGELASTFDDMLGAIERVASAQRRFVADASHELRAPLTTIKGSLEFLRKARDLPPEEQAAVIEDAYTEAERMAALVNDLLLLARADAAASSAQGDQAARLDDQMRGRRELIELDQLALDIFRYGRAQLAARNHAQLQLSIDGLEPVAIMADPGQIRQVLLILLDNAIKYTPAGKIRISVTRQGSRAAVSISDSGIGIEPEIRQHIYERFFRGDQARDRDQHGSGLGLAIAKWIVEAHNGEISVYSQPGKGSTFTILLPAVRRPGEHTSAKVPAVTSTSTRTTRSVVAGAISPLARLAGSVSRPRTMAQGDKPVPRKQSHDGRPAREGKAGHVGAKPGRRKRQPRSS
jgi:signal transduction histidine kinase